MRLCKTCQTTLTSENSLKSKPNKCKPCYYQHKADCAVKRLATAELVGTQFVCNRCDDELNETNWHPSVKMRGHRICITCHRRQSHTYGADPQNKTRKKALSKSWATNDPKYQRDRSVKMPEKQMLNGARGRAKRKGIPFSITLGDILIPEKCPVLGIPLDRDKRTEKPCGHPRDFAPSLDRINPSLGYVPGNVVVISYRANRIKNDAKLAELEALVSWLRTVAN